MKPIEKIDNSKFKCEVFAPDGTFIGEARMNKANNFYYPGLVPGQKYDLVFSYDGILIVVLSFMTEEAGEVVYLSPAHIVFNRGIEVPTAALIDSIKDKIVKRDQYQVPLQNWAKKALAIFIESTNSSNANQTRQLSVQKFKAGAALAKAVK